MVTLQVPLGQLISAIKKKPKLEEFTHHVILTPDASEKPVTVTELFHVLFLPLHKKQLPQLLIWAPASRVLNAQQKQVYLYIYIQIN